MTSSNNTKTFCLIERNINSTDFSFVDEHIEVFAIVGYVTFIALVAIFVITVAMVCCCSCRKSFCSTAEDIEEQESDVEMEKSAFVCKQKEKVKNKQET